MNPALPAENYIDHSHALRILVLNLITLPAFILAALCFNWWAQTGEVALLLIGWVTFGMAYDFFGHILGLMIPERKLVLELYARINFAALCFGIPFTALAGSFVMARSIAGPLSVTLVGYILPILAGSLAFGSLFLFARYKEIVVHGGVEFVLDKTHSYTNAIFVARRALLAASLLIALSTVVDGFGSNWLPWAAAFTGVFVASIPLHIMHKQIPSMLSEVLTQVLAIGAAWVVFIG